MPTGLGKTSVIDAAVFVAAAAPEIGRRRLFFVVDRRLVVDEAYLHAQALVAGLRPGAPAGPVSLAVSKSLSVITRAPDGEPVDPLTITRMRGGVTWSWRWLDRPDSYGVIVGTVDQVGSRLLFRGYGVGERLRPIDAALVGSDSLIVVDEAHLADAFVTTARSITRCESDSETGLTSRPPVVVTMSATVPAEGSSSAPHRISQADEDHPVAGKRLNAGRRLHLLRPAVTSKNAHTEIPKVLAAWARALASRPESATVGVVCNTVGRARAVLRALQADVTPDDGLDLILLTGRIRPIDRDRLLRDWYGRLKVGRERAAGRRLILVATQTVEVGANIDLDALVTESAAMPALVQRLGRVNRVADLPTSMAIVVHDPTVGENDPVYGPAREATWQCLSSLAAETLSPRAGARPDLGALGQGLPASPAALRRLLDGLSETERAGLQPRPGYVPALDDELLDAWSHTSPIWNTDTPVAPFLHGLAKGQPEVSLLWRAGLPDDQADIAAVLAAVPPTQDEMLDVPLAAARRWLAGRRPEAATVSDIEGDTVEDGDDERDPAPAEATARAGRLAVRWRDGTAKAIPTAALRSAPLQPGDVLVLSEDWGGCDEFGWDPEGVEPVDDVADLASRRRRPLVRLRPELIELARRREPELISTARSDEGPARIGLAELVATAEADGADGTPAPGTYRPQLSGILQAAEARRAASGRPDGPLEGNLRLLARDHTASVVVPVGAGASASQSDRDHRDGSGGWPVGSERLVVLACRGGGQLGDDGPFGSSVVAGEPYTRAGDTLARRRRVISLRAHQQAAAERAREFAVNLGLPAPLVTAVQIAAKLHDEGKRDPRFQAMLRDRPLHAHRRRPPEEPLAKSGMDPANREAFRRARLRSEYPHDMRHEALSARIAALTVATASRYAETGVDHDLVIHLVATHHGRGRAVYQPVLDPAPQHIQIALDGRVEQLTTEVTVDPESSRRFAALNARYGRWGLALLETIVRLADIWCSEYDEGEDT
ncbi:type I-U CRISPR-associated helicase/endonuclease Cas3 [Pseudofrankia sp. BMG5.36]|nr:type I-U CRISPR-associated helicase/endonuclease Cas3 [Pseudofrankia sp. BMG5.36]